MRTSESRFRVTDEVKQAAKLRAEAEAKRVIQEAETVIRERAAAKAKAKAEIGMLAAAARAAAKAKAEATALEEARMDATGKDEWFYLQNQEQFGPVTLEVLRELVANPDLEFPIRLVWAEGMSIWRPAYEVPRVCDPDGTYDVRSLVGNAPVEADFVVHPADPELGMSFAEDLHPGGRELGTPRADVEPDRNPRQWEESTGARDRERAENESRLRVIAETRAMQESKLRAEAEARAIELERWKGLAEAKAAEEARNLAELTARAREVEKLRQLAEAKALEQARLREVAEAKVRAEALRRAAAEAKAAEEERIAVAAKARADEEARAKVAMQAKAAVEAEAAAVAKARVEEESRLRKEAEAKAAEEARQAALAKQRADQESRAKALSEAKAVEESRIAAREKARAEEESRMRREAEARASEEARQAAKARARAENEAKAKAQLELSAAEEARRAAAAEARADENDKLRRAEAAARQVASNAVSNSEMANQVDPDPIATQSGGRMAPLQAACVSNPDRVEFSAASSISAESAKQDEEAILNAEIDALAEQEAKLEALANERAEKEAKARAEFKSRASQASRAAIVAKRKVRRQVLARAMESARLKSLEEAASALMEETPDHEVPLSEVQMRAAEAFLPEPESAAIASRNLLESPRPEVMEPVPNVESAVQAPVSESEPPSNAGNKRRHSFLSGKKVWYYTCEGERVGPVTFDELKEMADNATLHPRLDLVWKKGRGDWLPAGRIDGLFQRQVESSAKTAERVPVPKHKRTTHAPVRNRDMPGARRRSLLLVVFILPFAWEFALKLSQPMLAARLGVDSAARINAVTAWLPFLLILHFGLKRLVNLGMSRWWYLAVFAPVVNLWVGYRCFACPCGYAFHRRMDAAGVLLAVLYWLGALALIATLLGYASPWSQWLNHAGNNIHVSQAIAKVHALAGR